MDLLARGNFNFFGCKASIQIRLVKHLAVVIFRCLAVTIISVYYPSGKGPTNIVLFLIFHRGLSRRLLVRKER
jgi:hypothetical protein